MDVLSLLNKTIERPLERSVRMVFAVNCLLNQYDYVNQIDFVRVLVLFE